MVSRHELDQFLRELLSPELFDDYGPNGLQIEGGDTISRVAFAVSATRASAASAVEWGAHALFVHHGLFWKFHGVRSLTGAFAQRVLPLVRAEINLFGYHLPLDAHLEVGNAAGIARRLGMSELRAFAESKGAPLGVQGRLPAAPTATRLAAQLEEVLDHRVLISSPDSNAKVESMGIITGGANRYWTEAARAGLDAYLTGEMSEHDWHEAQEGGVHMFAGGHHATERFGPLDVMARLQAEFPGLECRFFDSDNPA